MTRFLVALLLISSAWAQSGQVTAIVGAVVVDGSGSDPSVATVLIRGDRIEAVGRDVDVPAGARIIRAEGHALLPGLFDLHTHLTASGVPGVRADWGKALKAYLLAGVTSVVEFGSYPEMFEPMRRLMRTRVVPGPRVHLAARFSTPGGHGVEGGRPDFFTQEVLTPAEARAAMKRIAPYEPDVIKVFTDGWRYGSAPDMTSMEEETLRAIVEEAHQRGFEVLTHTVTVGKAKVAARAGVDVIAHGLGDGPADEELLALLKKAGVTYAPTLAVYEPRPRFQSSDLLQAVLGPEAWAVLAKERFEPILSLPRARRWQYLLQNAAALREAGIAFGVGTDAGMSGTYHGWATLRELELLVAGGLSPLEAIKAATSGSARALRVEGERGTIAPGKLADLLLVEGAPHRRIRDIYNVRRVFLNGQEVDRPKLISLVADPNPTPIPAIPARERIDDFENAERSLLDTLRINGTDSGHDKSKMMFTRTLRSEGNHALTITVRMAEKEDPFALVAIPLSKGAVEPVDARTFKGIRFEARGEGPYTFAVSTRRESYSAPFEAGAAWRTISIPFAQLKGKSRWTGDDLLMVVFSISRPAGFSAWLEIDNVSFFR